MVPSSSTRDQSVGRSRDLSVFLATLLWSLSVCLMAWMIPSLTAARLRGLIIPPTIAFPTIAAITVVVAWRVRRHPGRGYLVLAGSLLCVAWFLMTLR